MNFYILLAVCISMAAAVPTVVVEMEEKSKYDRESSVVMLVCWILLKKIQLILLLAGNSKIVGKIRQRI